MMIQQSVSCVRGLHEDGKIHENELVSYKKR